VWRVTGILSTVDEPTVPLRDYVDTLHRELKRRLDESAQDREHIREGIGARVPRVEYDRDRELLLARVERIEGLIARLFGGLTVVALVIGIAVALSRYVVG
jgi:hypothetical protein